MVRFNEPFLTGREMKYIEDVFRQRQFYGAGKYTRLCTDRIAEHIGTDTVLLTDSCTSALEMAALLLRDFSKRQEIIVPSYTFTSSASAFARAGFDIVFCEVNEDDLMINVSDARSKVSDYTVGLVAVHYGGMCADLEGVIDLCNDLNLALIEDSAQGYGAYYEGRHLGTFGDFGCFSFHETKNIHCGLGGALVVNADQHKKRARYIWERGTNRQEVLKGLIDKYSWVEVGGSFYPSELQAAFLYAQLEAVDDNLAQRKALYEVYASSLDLLRSQGKLHFSQIPQEYEANFHAFVVVFNSEEDADHIRDALRVAGVSAYIGYVPLHSSPVGLSMGYVAESLPVTQNVAQRVLRMPLHNNMTVDDVAKVCNIVLDEFRHD